ncbi:MAG: hypothetical protein KGI98_17460, partial [Euryarchaeota archaeon]|nr:hypothetical protein [Euryarchaeota archaeon]
MGVKVNCTFEGVSSKGIFGEKKVLWRDVGACRVEDAMLMLFFQPKPEARVGWVDYVQVPPKEVAGVLLFPSFPRWMLPAEQVKGLGDARVDPSSFGPPGDTTWIPRSVPSTESLVELWPAGLGKVKGIACTTARVGLFREGVAFQRVSTEMEVYPWRFIQLLRSGDYLLATWIQTNGKVPGVGEENESDRGQARSMVGYASGRTWDLPP